MNRRSALKSTATLACVAASGCVTANSDDTDESDLRPAENWTDTDVATATFDELETPICAEKKGVDSTIEGEVGQRSVTDHEFFRDETGRYGVRGRYEGGHIQWMDATFSSGSREPIETRHRIYRLGSDETYEFTIVASDGDPAEIDHYQITLPDGANSGPGPSTREGLELLDDGWGIIGESGEETVYGFAATIQNTGETISNPIYVSVNAYIDDKTVVHTDQEIIRDLEPGETHTVYSPYLRCDPGSVTETDVDYFQLKE